ncbi:MAG: GNAT family N-acetyltransferase [Olsenella sp.]|jgi:ribosomal protein S18 acetylase RimI-like enzyme|nr:GNAT family N-acetyltransferase [Olsenella sp.]MCI1289903.1 GNAT family N-acetyltransferase [Olsenella sp.]
MPTDTSQSEVIYRPFADDDFDAVARICARTWASDVEGVYDRITFGRVFTAGSLRRSQFSIVAQKGLKVVGACFGGFTKDGAIEKNERWEKRFEELMGPARKRAKIGGPNVEELLFSRLRMYTTADVFISRGYSNGDAELNLCVVDPASRRNGIGSALMEEAVMRFCEHNCRGFFTMMTKDSDCEFSEHMGLRLIQEKRGIYGDPDAGVIYLYGRRL